MTSANAQARYHNKTNKKGNKENDQENPQSSYETSSATVLIRNILTRNLLIILIFLIELIILIVLITRQLFIKFFTVQLKFPHRRTDCFSGGGF